MPKGAASASDAEERSGEDCEAGRALRPSCSGGEEDVEDGAPKARFSRKKLRLMHDDYDRRGIVYINYIPPKLKPFKLKTMLSEYGDLGRLYLAPEDSRPHRNKKHGKRGKSKGFREGWVEFMDKKVAKRVARILNGEPMGGKRRSPFYSCLWSMKYLHKFKWDYLREEIAYQKATYEQRLSQELRDAKREREFYLSQVDRAKLEERKRQREVEEGAEGTEGAEGAEGGPHEAKPPDAGAEGDDVKRLRYFRQREAKADALVDKHAPEIANDVLMMLAGSFSGQLEGQ